MLQIVVDPYEVLAIVLSSVHASWAINVYCEHTDQPSTDLFAEVHIIMVNINQYLKL